MSPAPSRIRGADLTNYVPIAVAGKYHQGYFDSEEGFWASEETYWAMYYHHPYFNYEWNNGYLEEKGRPYEDIVMHELVKDELYQDYILLYYQEDKRQEATTNALG